MFIALIPMTLALVVVTMVLQVQALLAKEARQCMMKEETKDESLLSQ